MAGVELANAWITIKPSTKEIAPAVKNALGKTDSLAADAGKRMGASIDKGFGSKVKSAVGKVGGLAAGLATAAGAAGTLQAGFKKVTSIEDTTQALTVLMGSADEATKYIDKLKESNEKSTYSTDAWLEAGKTLVAFGVDAEQADKTVTALGEAAATAGGSSEDLLRLSDAFGKASAAGKISGDTIQSLAEGGVDGLTILGNEFGVTTDEMQKMISEGAVPAEEGIKILTDGIIEGSHGIAGSANATSGVMAAMADTTSGHLKNMVSQFNNVSAELWNKVAPAIKEVAKWFETHAADLAQWIKETDFSELTEKAAPAFETLKDTAEAMWPSLESMGRSFGTIAANITVDTWSAFAGVLNALAPLVEAVLVPLLEQVASFSKDHPKTIEAIVLAFLGFKGVGKIAGPVGKGFKAIKRLGGAAKIAGKAVKAGGLIGGMKSLAGMSKSANPVVGKMAGKLTKFGGAAKVVGGAFKTIGKIALKAIRFINPWVGAISLVAGALTWFFTQTEVGQELWQSMVETISDGWDWLVDTLGNGWSWLRDNVFSPMATFVTETIAPALQSAWDGVQGAWDKFSGAVSSAWDTVQPILETIGQVMVNVLGGAIAVGITPFILGWKMLSGVIQWVWNDVLQPFFSWLGNGLSTLWNSVVVPAVDGIKNAWSALGTAMQNVWGFIRDNVLTPLGNAFKDLWDKAVKVVIDNIVKGWQALSSAVQSVGAFIRDNVLTPLGNAFKWLWDNAVKPVLDWIQARFRALSDALATIWAWIKQNVIDTFANAMHWLWDTAVQPVLTWVSDKWDWMKNQLAAGYQWIKGNVFEPFKSALSSLKSFFGTVVDGIRNVWNGLKRALAAPINFMIETVYNGGIARAWDTIGSFLPLNPKTAKRLSKIGGYATGGAIKGAGTATSDSILAWLSNGEHVWDAEDVRNLGGQRAMYAMRRAAEKGRGFTYDGNKLTLLPHTDNRRGDLLGAAPGLFPKYKDGGEVRPMWEMQLERGHRWAKSRHGRPYVLGGSADGGGGTDCSGFMSGIANVIQGGSGARQWATMAFNGGGNQQMASGPQGFVGGLKANTFNIGIHNGGAAGGHTAGTLSAVGPFGTTNVESGGSPSMVKYGINAAGADDPYFETHYHLPIGPDGAFVSGGSGSISPETMRETIIKKAMHFVGKFLDPVKNMLPKGPPHWKDIPKGVFKSGKDAFPKAIKSVVDGLKDKLGSVFSAAQSFMGNIADRGRDVVENVRRSVGLHDQGGFLQHGNMALNLSGKPEPVLTAAQWDSVSGLVRSVGDLVPAIRQQANAIADQVKATEDYLAKVANPNTLEGISARSFAGKIGEIFGELGFEQTATVTKTLLDAEQSLLKERQEHEARLKDIRDKERALAEARRKVAEASSGSSEKVAAAEEDLSKARKSGDADKISEAEKKLADTRRDASKQQAEDVSKANDEVSKAEQDLAEARKKSAKALDTKLYEVNPGIYHGLSNAAEQVGKVVPQAGAALAGVAAMAGPAGVSIGGIIAAVQTAITVFKTLAEAISSIIVKVRQAKAEVYKGLGDYMGNVASINQMIDKQREKVAGLRIDYAMAQIELASAVRNVRMAQMDGVKSQLEGQRTLAEAQAKFDEQRRVDMRRTAAQYEDLTTSFDRFRWAAKKGVDKSLASMASWTDETHALYEELQAARMNQLLVERQAQKANLEAVYKHSLAVLDLQDATRDLQNASRQLAIMSGKTFGFDSASGLIGQRIADLYSEKAQLKSEKGQNWWKLFSWHLSGAGGAANERLKQIDREIGHLQSMPEWEGFSDKQQSTIDRVMRRAGVMGMLGGSGSLDTLIKSSALGDPQRALDEIKLKQQLADIEAQKDELRSKIDRGLAEVEHRQKLDPLETEIAAIEAQKGSHEAMSEYWRSDNAGVRDAIKALADHQAESARDIHAMVGKPTELVFQFPKGKKAISIDEFREYAEEMNRSNEDIRMRVDALENPRPSALTVAASRR